MAIEGQRQAVPMFFLPWQIFHEMWGAPKGTGIFNFMEKESDTRLFLDKKTRKKLLDGQGVSQRSLETLTEWIEDIIPANKRPPAWNNDEILTNMRLEEIKWRSSLLTLQNGEYGKDYGHTIDYILSLLDEESVSYVKTIALDNPHQRFRFYCSTDYFNRYSPSLSNDAFNNQDLNSVQQTTEWAIAMCIGMVSLQMDILSRAEVEFYERNRDRLSTGWPPKSRLISFLPELECETNNKIETTLPIEKFFRFFRERLGYTSWEELARFVPMQGEADLSSQKRTLLRWVKEKHIPSYESVTVFFKSAAQSKGARITIDLLDIYAATAFMTRMINKVLPELHAHQVSAEIFLNSFQCYSGHFDRHMAAAALRQQQPEIT